MVQFASYLRRVLCKTRLIFPRINGPNIAVVNMTLILRDTLDRDLSGGGVIQLLYSLMIDSMRYS